MTRTQTTDMAVRSAARLRRARAGRRLFALALAVFVLAGLLLAFGERTERVAATGGGYELAVSYPVRTRGGLSQDIDIRIRRAGGFEEPVTVALTLDYMRLYEQQAILPEPASQTATPERVAWTFDPPPGDTLRVLVDVRVEPYRYRGGAGVLQVLDGGEAAASVPLETVVMP